MFFWAAGMASPHILNLRHKTEEEIGRGSLVMALWAQEIHQNCLTLLGDRFID